MAKKEAKQEKTEVLNKPMMEKKPEVKKKEKSDNAKLEAIKAKAKAKQESKYNDPLAGLNLEQKVNLLLARMSVWDATSKHVLGK